MGIKELMQSGKEFIQSKEISLKLMPLKLFVDKHEWTHNHYENITLLNGTKCMVGIELIGGEGELGGFTQIKQQFFYRIENTKKDINIEEKYVIANKEEKKEL